MARLDPKVARAVKTAEDTEVLKYPLASIGATLATGGGIGAGRQTLVYGNTGSGKSLLLMQSIGMWQKQGLICAYFDVEGTYDKTYAARLGVNNKELIIEHTKTFGKIVEKARPLLKAKVDILVVDSISDAVADVFVDEDGELVHWDKQGQIGAHAKACTRMVGALHYMNENTAVILISQTTTEIGQTYTKQIPHGGKRVQFDSTQIIKLTSSNVENKMIKGEITHGSKVEQMAIGRKVELLVEKNKMGAQSRTAEYDVYFDGPDLGIDRINELIKLGKKYGIVEGTTWLTWAGEKWQGEKNMTAWLKSHPEEQEKLRLEIELSL